MSESLGIFMFAPDVYSTRFIRLDRILSLISNKVIPDLGEHCCFYFLTFLIWSKVIQINFLVYCIEKMVIFFPNIYATKGLSAGFIVYCI